MKKEGKKLIFLYKITIVRGTTSSDIYRLNKENK